MAIGHFMMAVEQLFLFALGALILGNGAFKPNISTQVGGLYAPGDPRRDRAYLDLLCRHQCRRVPRAAGLRHARRRGRLALRLCRGRRRHADRARHLSLRLAAPAARRSAEGEGRARRAKAARPRRMARRRRAACAVPAGYVFWATYEQQGNTIALWADAYTDRTIDFSALDCAKSRRPGSRPSIHS